MNGNHIRVLRPGDETALEEFLQAHVDSSLFLLSNLRQAGLVDRGRRYEGTYAAAFSRDNIVAVVALFWNGSLVYQAPEHLVTLQRAAIRKAERPVRGLLGPCGQVEAGLRALKVRRNQVRVDDPQILYSLVLSSLALPASLRSGAVHVRRIAARDVELLSRWRAASRLEAMNASDTPGLYQEARDSVERMLESQRMWVLEAEGQVVACSTFNAEIAEVVQVGGVYTPPELRSRGYARAVIAGSLLDARAEGVRRAVLFTDVDNVPAQRAYVAIGFQPIGDYRIVLLR